MIRALSLFLMLIALATGAAVTTADAQSAAAEGSPGVATVGALPAGPHLALAQEAPSGLPERPQAPRTLRDYWHLYIAFAIAWLLLFGYAIHLGRRFGRLEEELQRLRGA